MPDSLTAASILRKDQRLDRLVDAIGEQHRQQFTRAINRWRAQVTTDIHRLPTTKSGALSRRGSARLATRNLTASASRILTPELERAMEYSAAAFQQPWWYKRGEPGLPVAARKQLTLQRLRETAVGQLRIDQAVQQVSHIIESGIQQGQLSQEVALEVGEVMDTLATYSRQWAEHATMNMAQVVSAASQDKRLASDCYLYSGPYDERCRTFCIARVARVWKRATIDKMDNGMTPNTFLTRGGYNCRHVWRHVVDPTLVKQADTGRVVVGGIADRLKELARLKPQKGGSRPIRRTA